MNQDNLFLLNWYKSNASKIRYYHEPQIITLPTREELLAQEDDDCDDLCYSTDAEYPLMTNSISEKLTAHEDDFLIDGKILGICVPADYEGFILSEETQYKKPLYTLSYKESPFAPITGIHIITGQSGNGKTMLLTQIIVALIKGQYGQLRYLLSETNPNPKVLYVDTEMEEFNTVRVRDRINYLLERQFGEKHEDLIILRLRDIIKTDERWQKILSAVHNLRPTIVIIDGLIDLVNDVNDYSDCYQIISQCSIVASKYECSLWGVIHENPGTTKLVGHLGSVAEKKASDILQTTKNKGANKITFEVSHKKARGKDLQDWRFVVDDLSCPIGIPLDLSDYGMDISDNDNSESDNELLKKIKNAFCNNYTISLSFTELQKKIGKSKNGKNIVKAEKLGYIEKKDDKYYLKK